MIRLPSVSSCTPNCKYSATYIPTFTNRFAQPLTVPSVLFQNFSDAPVFSNEIPSYDLDAHVKCNCTFDEENSQRFDAYLRFFFF